MSILIKGIDIPKDAGSLDLVIYDKKDNYLTDYEILLTEAIQIPKGHGRLIDGDELAEHMKRDNPQTSKTKWMKILVKYAPTILEAEE